MKTISPNIFLQRWFSVQVLNVSVNNTQLVAIGNRWCKSYDIHTLSRYIDYKVNPGE